jgi:hypothetical protein
VDGNKWPSLGHYTNISVQRLHKKRKTLTGHFRNYESFPGIPTHRTEIQTAKSSTSVDVGLTVVSFSSTAYNTKHTRKRIQFKELAPCIKRMHVNCTLKLQNHYMNHTQVYCIHHCQIQNCDYNTTEVSREFPFQNYFFIPLFWTAKTRCLHTNIIQKHLHN